MSDRHGADYIIVLQLDEIFSTGRPVIGVIHLLALPGAPDFDGSMPRIHEHAAAELAALTSDAGSVDGVIVENFWDRPFYPARVPAETTAALAAVTREVVRASPVPVGVNVLRNDAQSAIAIAAATGARFVRVNVHMGVVVSEQGLLLGASHDTLRLRAALGAQVAIFADVGVKHAAALVDRGVISDAIDNQERGLADALIVSGPRTGAATSVADVAAVREHSTLPVFIGSGATDDTVGELLQHAHGVIVGTHFKRDGVVEHPVDPVRVGQFVAAARAKS